MNGPFIYVELENALGNLPKQKPLRQRKSRTKCLEI